jgi:hypothetical protein
MDNGTWIFRVCHVTLQLLSYLLFDSDRDSVAVISSAVNQMADADYSRFRRPDGLTTETSARSEQITTELSEGISYKALKASA